MYKACTAFLPASWRSTTWTTRCLCAHAKECRPKLVNDNASRENMPTKSDRLSYSGWKATRACSDLLCPEGIMFICHAEWTPRHFSQYKTWCMRLCAAFRETPTLTVGLPDRKTDDVCMSAVCCADPQDIACAMAFLLNPGTDFITGQVSGCQSWSWQILRS